jgi:hypothetical protein
MSKTKIDQKELTGEAFDAMSDAEKAEIVREIEEGTSEQRTAESKPMNRAERARWREWKRRRGGRPKVGQGSKMIALTVEMGLLKRADSYAKAKGMKRSEMFAQGLELMMKRSKAS